MHCKGERGGPRSPPGARSSANALPLAGAEAATVAEPGEGGSIETGQVSWAGHCLRNCVRDRPAAQSDETDTSDAIAGAATMRTTQGADAVNVVDAAAVDAAAARVVAVGSAPSGPSVQPLLSPTPSGDETATFPSRDGMRRGEAEGWRWGDCHGERLMESEPEAAAAVAVAVAEDAVTRAGELSTDNPGEVQHSAGDGFSRGERRTIPSLEGATIAGSAIGGGMSKIPSEAEGTRGDGASRGDCRGEGAAAVAAAVAAVRVGAVAGTAVGCGTCGESRGERRGEERGEIWGDLGKRCAGPT